MKKTIMKIDIPLLISIILLCIIGLIMVFSSSSEAAILRYHKPTTYFFIRQVLFFAISFVAGFIILKVPTKVYNSISIIYIMIVLASLVLILIYGGITNHVQSWFSIPGIGFSIQPSEFAKSAIIIFMATLYNHLALKKQKNIYFYLLPLAISFVIAILIAMQPDFGSATILFGISFCIFISIPFLKDNARKIITILAVAFVVLALGLLYSGKEILNSEQMSRFNFMNPCQRYKEKTGYQVCNGFIAINNGGLTGVGIGNSTQKHLYLPESHTDFIFAILVEELGSIFGVFVILLYGFVLYRIFKIAKNSYNLRNSILAYGTFWLFAFHIIINLSGMFAILPLTGVPLPLLSYGGSSTINFVVMLFITERVAIENKNDKYKYELNKL